MFELWNTMPTLLIGELLILGFTITNLYHVMLIYKDINTYHSGYLLLLLDLLIIICLC